MSWSGDPSATKYVLEASKDATFPANGVVFRWESPTPSTDILITTVDRGSYSARVFAVDADGKRVRADVAVVDETGRRLGLALAYEATNFSKRSQGDTLDQPAFVVPPPPPGRYRVEFTAEGFFPQTLDARVAAGETTEVTATLIRR